MEYELAYYDSEVHHFNHYTTRTPLLTFWNFDLERMKDKGKKNCIALSKIWKFSKLGYLKKLPLTWLLVAELTWNQFYFHCRVNLRVPYHRKVYAKMYCFSNNLISNKILWVIHKIREILLKKKIHKFFFP